MATVTFDWSEMQTFFTQMQQAKDDLPKQMKLWLEALGVEFLSVVQDEIIRLKVVDTRLLLNSFQKNADDGVWELTDGDLTLSVGTNVEYASYVNDGHWTCKAGETMRFIPGTWKGGTYNSEKNRWEGGKFTYDPSAKTGMVLKQKWVDGTFYWESAINICEKLFPQYLESALDK